MLYFSCYFWRGFSSVHEENLLYRESVTMFTFIAIVRMGGYEQSTSMRMSKRTFCIAWTVPEHERIIKA